MRLRTLRSSSKAIGLVLAVLKDKKYDTPAAVSDGHVLCSATSQIDGIEPIRSLELDENPKFVAKSEPLAVGNDSTTRILESRSTVRSCCFHSWSVSSRTQRCAKAGAEQYMGDLEFIFYGNHLDRTIPRIQRPYIV